MIRALITAALAAAAATQLLHVPLDVALGYSVAICAISWYLWPLLRRPAKLLLRRRPRTSTGPSLAWRPAPIPPRAAPAHITQITHHHYYGGTPATPLRPDYTVPALPRRTEGRIASDEILDAIIVDIDDDGTR